jgi:hypothetical protein
MTAVALSRRRCPEYEPFIYSPISFRLPGGME